jgi:hypothetical protein
MTTFDYVVPVGCNCRNTWNLRRHFGFGNGFPFDWWITPLPALLTLLQKFDIAYLYAPELLEAVSSEDGSISSIRHRELGIFFHHEFPRAWRTPGTPVLPNWRDHLQIPISRTVALRDRFLALRGRILFVRNMAITDESPDPIYPLLNALFPRETIRLLVINTTGEVVHTELPTLTFSDDGPEWRGNVRAWRVALRTTRFTLNNAALKPFNPAAKPDTRWPRKW